MLEQGLKAGVKGLMPKGLANALQTLAREWFAHFDGKWDETKAIEEIKKKPLCKTPAHGLDVIPSHKGKVEKRLVKLFVPYSNEYDLYIMAGICFSGITHFTHTLFELAVLKVLVGDQRPFFLAF